MQQQNPQKVEASKVPEYIKKAAKKAAEFNSNFNRERMEERRAYFDLQTHVSPTVFSMDSADSDPLWDVFGSVSVILTYIVRCPDYSGTSGQVQGSGSRANPDRALPCGPHTWTVPRLLQKVHSHAVVHFYIQHLSNPLLKLLLSVVFP